MSESSQTLAERLADLQERNEQPQGIPEEEAKKTFLELLELGNTPPQAAKKVGRTATWFKRRRAPEGVNYDAEFAAEYRRIMDADGPYRENLVWNARTWLVEAAAGGDVRAIEKLLMAYDTEYAFMRAPQLQGNMNVENLMIVMKDLPTPLLEQAREALMAKQRKELPVIDAT